MERLLLNLGKQMSRIALSGILFLLLSLQPVGARSEAVPYKSYAFTDSSRARLDEKVRADIGHIFNGVLSLVEINAPTDRNTLFEWKGDRAPLQNKSFQFILACTSDPEVKETESKRHEIDDVLEGVDAFTRIVPQGEGIFAIETWLIVDRIFYDKESKERSDVTARLLAAMAHEIFGNVQTYLELDPSKTKKMDPAIRSASEIRSFRESIALMERMVANPPLVPDSKKTVFEKFMKDLHDAIARERQSLRAVESLQNKPKPD